MKGDLSWVEQTTAAVGGAIGWIADIVASYPNVFRVVAVFAALTAAVYLAYTAFRMVRGTFRFVRDTVRSFDRAVTRMVHRMEKARIFRSLKGKFMAKWKNGILSDAIYDAIFNLQMKGQLSDAEARRSYQTVAKALGLHDQLTRRYHKLFLRHYFLGSKDKNGKETPPIYQKLAGPRRENFAAAGGLPEVKVEQPNVVSSDMLNRIRAKKQNAA